MKFIGILVLINISCFLPLYLLHARASPNPFKFLRDRDESVLRFWLKLLYARPASTDPFRINFDFTFLVLLTAAAGVQGAWLSWTVTALLAFSFVAILYASVMHSVFGRPPTLVADLQLARAGLSLAGRRFYLLSTVLAVALAAIVGLAHTATVWLMQFDLDGRVALLIAVALLPLALFHGRTYGHEFFLGRAVYSSLLHLWRNIEHGRVLNEVLKKSSDYFERRNSFKNVTLKHRPTVVVLCIESYGSVVYRDAEHSAAVADLVAEHEERLRSAGLLSAATYSDAPIFAGGSWLSYASLTYGIELAEAQLYDGLFAAGSPFGAYESLFHVLKRNGYRNVVLCPLGGVQPEKVDWGQINRCFQSDLTIDFESLGYSGPLVNFFGVVQLFSPLDQFSLNYAYERASSSGPGPFSLFFCTLNSHYPWESVGEVVGSWRSLNDADAPLHRCSGNKRERYRASMRYQLDYVLRFVYERANDDVVYVIFGDHQPPMITERAMGKQTPVHVIARNRDLVNVFLEHGFVEGFALSGKDPVPMKHQGFLSLFLKAMQTTYGAESASFDYCKEGVRLFDERSAA
jgi:hypothetical protein